MTDHGGSYLALAVTFAQWNSSRKVVMASGPFSCFRAKDSTMRFFDHFTSQSIRLLAYDERRRRLYVFFTQGDSVLAYGRVPSSVFHDFVCAPSKGRFYEVRIRSRYRGGPLTQAELRAVEVQIGAEQGAKARAWMDEMSRPILE